MRSGVVFMGRCEYIVASAEDASFGATLLPARPIRRAMSCSRAGFLPVAPLGWRARRAPTWERNGRWLALRLLMEEGASDSGLALGLPVLVDPPPGATQVPPNLAKVILRFSEPVQVPRCGCFAQPPRERW